MVQGLYIPADDFDQIEEREFLSLADYQTAVGGWIEAVDVPGLNVTIYVNEEGLLRHLPFNPRASFLWWYHVPGARQAMLVGNAVIVGMPDRNGNQTNIPADLSALLQSDGPFAVLLRMGGDPATRIDPASKLSSIVLPLASGDPTWFVSSAHYEDYFSAMVWAMVMRESWTDVVDAKVSRLSAGPEHLSKAIGEASSG